MLNASDVIGRQITVRDGGRDIGKIKDLVVDPSGREVMAIVLSDGVFTSSRVASWRSVQAFGPDTVVIDSQNSVVKASDVPEIKAVLDKKTRIKGLKLVTTSGKELGKIVDLAFDETTGEVDGYELSSGLWSGAFDGNPFLPTPQWIELGKDVAFVAPEVEPTIKAAEGGIKKVFRRSDKPVETESVPTGTQPAGTGSQPAATDSQPMPLDSQPPPPEAP